MNMNFINLVFNRNSKSNDVSTAFDCNKKDISADQAYRKSRFGCIKTDKELLNEFFEDVRDRIEAKNLKGEFCCIIEVNPDLLQYIPKIMDKLRGELGYKAIILDDNVEIVNKATNTTDTMNAGLTFIMLIWNKEAVKNTQVNYDYVNIHNLENESETSTEKIENI